MENLYLMIDIVLIIIIVFLISNYRKLLLEKKIFKLASWIISDDSECRANLQLYEYIANEQNSFLERYRIVGEEEWRITKEILCAFQKFMLELLFDDGLKLPKSKYDISGEDFFMFYLQGYLENHQCDYSFIGYDMHESTVSYKEYGSYGCRLYDATYNLTHFAVVYHKLYYIAYCYCKSSKPLNNEGKMFMDEENIGNIIDSRVLSVSQF